MIRLRVFFAILQSESFGWHDWHCYLGMIGLSTVYCVEAFKSIRPLSEYELILVPTHTHKMTE